MSYKDISLDKAVKFYQDTQAQVYKIGRRILEHKYPERSFPENDWWFFREGKFTATFGTSWGRRCSCCSPERMNIDFPNFLLWAEEDEILSYLKMLPTEGEDYWDEVE